MTSLARPRRVDPLLLVVAFVTVLLLGLGFLQYKWTGELSEAERTRLHAGLKLRAETFGQDLDREITRAFLRLQLDPASVRDHDFKSYAERYERWRSLAVEPSLVKDVYLAESGARPNEPSRLSRYVPERKTFEPAEWPANLAAARDRTLGGERGPGSERAGGERGPGGERGRAGERTSGDERGPGGEPSPGPMTRGFRQGPLSLLEDGTPVIVAPAPSFERGPGQGPGRGPYVGGGPMGVFSYRLAGFTLIVLDEAVLTGKLLPELERRHFPESEDPAIAVRVARLDKPGDPVYLSSDDAARIHPEASVGLLELRFDEVSEDDLHALPPPPWGGGERRSPGERLSFGERRPQGERSYYGVRMSRGRGRDGRTGLWTLDVAHRGGSVDTLVAGARDRNLLVGFSVLLLLGTTTVVLALSARRAERMAARQMEFVAAVSHELRTPVSVICSAGENLADGLVQGREGVARYGTLVRDEGRRLARLVEQVLDFAGTYSGHRPYRQEPVEVTRLVEEALEAAKAAVGEAGVTVEQEIATGLPGLVGDTSALARALRNLIENAVKYRGDDDRVAVRARAHERGGATWVRLEVEDHGLGIAAAEQKHLFEPFWRGPEATGRQIRGSGLGLALVRSIVTAHGGQVSVESEPGRGSVFALELPAARTPEATSGAREENHDDIPHIAG